MCFPILWMIEWQGLEELAAFKCSWYVCAEVGMVLIIVSPLQALIDYGADIEKKDDYGETALAVASARGALRTVEVRHQELLLWFFLKTILFHRFLVTWVKKFSRKSKQHKWLVQVLFSFMHLVLQDPIPSFSSQVLLQNGADRWSRSNGGKSAADSICAKVSSCPDQEPLDTLLK